MRLRDEFVYLAALMDVYTRSIRGWHLSRHLEQHRPEIHHSDQGVQYAAPTYIQTLQAFGVQISMAAVGEPTENGYAERLMRTIKEDEVTLYDYADFHGAYQHLGRFLDDVYQHKRMHSVLGYLTPMEFETYWLQQNRRAVSRKLAPP